jgi:hypothetical protein
VKDPSNGVFGRRLRTLVVDGTESVFPSGVDEDLIFNAALKRADHLINEKMDELNSLTSARKTNR